MSEHLTRTETKICDLCNKLIVFTITDKTRTVDSPFVQDGLWSIYHYDCYLNSDKCKIPYKFKEKNFDNLDINNGNRDAIEYIKQWKKDNKGFLLTGKCGTGKTHLLYSFYKRWLRLYRNTNDIVFTQVFETMNKIRKETLEDGSESSTLKKLEKVPALIIDDIGAEKLSEFSYSNLYQIINTRYNNNLPMFLSTNFNGKELEEKIGERIMSRLFEMCEFFKLEGKDHRKEII